MEYRQLGNSGVRVSVVGLGTNRFGSKEVGQAEVNRLIDGALEAGVNFLDTANVYNDGRSEETLGTCAERTHGQGCHGDQIFLPAKNQRQRLGRVALSHDPSRGAESTPTANRSYRSPLLPSLGRHHADRRNLARLGRFDSHGQGDLHRRVALCVVATGPRQRARRAQRLDAVSSSCSPNTIC